MPLPVHAVERPDGDQSAFSDRAIVGHQFGIANAAGGAGASVTTAVSWPAGSLPPNYFVDVEPSQDCFVTITNKTSSGFNVVMAPTVPSTGTISAGTFNVKVSA